jgi:hypothetical protein
MASLEIKFVRTIRHLDMGCFLTPLIRGLNSFKIPITGSETPFKAITRLKTISEYLRNFVQLNINPPR